MPSTEDDESLARALQEEFRRDYEASLSRSSQHLVPSATFEALLVPPPSPRESHAQLARSRRLEQERRDPEMARRLGQEDASRRCLRGTYTSGTPVIEAVIATAPITAAPPWRSTGQQSSVSGLGAAPAGQTGRRLSDNRRSSSPGRGASHVSRSIDARPPSTRRPVRSQSLSQSSHPSTSPDPPTSGSRGGAISPASDPVDPSLSPMVDSSTPRSLYPIDVDDPDDIELAMRVQQEERDAALAAELAREDQESASRRVTGREERRNERIIASRCTIRRVAGVVILVAIVAAVVVVTVIIVGGQTNLPGIPNILDNDPYSGSGELGAWKNDGNGLKLEVVNALQEEWYTAFGLALDDWENGEPDALTLTRTSSEYDSNCDPIKGKLKVCNGNYGDTQWKGINYILFSNGWIISSAAKLNEYYLGDASFDDRRYTMCHEIGHGFGLPHTDENSFNKDLGNCMDYTNNPSVNKSPDTGNFEYLLGLYGSAGGRMLDMSDEGDENLPYDNESLPYDLRHIFSQDVKWLEDGSEHKWTVLHKTKHGRVLKMDLGNAYTLQVKVLYAF